MFEMLKNVENQNCQSFGYCMTDPRVNALCELLTNEIKQIAFYIVKINEFKIINEEIISKCIEALCVDFSNVNFNEKNFIDMYKRFVKYRIQASKFYNNIHKNTTLPYETIKAPFDDDLKDSIINMIKKGQKLLKENRIYTNIQSEQLFELINVLVKDTARNISKIKDFDEKYNEYDFEVLRFLNLTNSPLTRVAKLKRRIREFIEINYQTKKDLKDILDKNYGPKISAKVSLAPLCGKSVLVSGDNFKELEMILKCTEGKEINVYTHDMLFMAHNYTKFKNFKNLKGHFGTNNPRFDFSNFKGVIYVTKHYEQRIDSIVKGSIFTTNSIMPKGISKIENGNFEPLIKACLNHEGFERNYKKNIVDVPYNKDKLKQIKESKEKITIVVGSNDKENNENAINLFSPSEISFLFDICENENNIKSVIFANCHMQTLILAFILKLKFGHDIKFGKCPNYYVNPNLIKCLKEEYGMKFAE